MMARDATPLPFVQLSAASASEFARACRAVSLAASRDNLRRLLTGVHIVTSGRTFLVEASDSYRLHRVEVDVLDVDGARPSLPAYEAVVPATFLKLLPDKLRNIPIGGVRVDLSPGGDRFGWCHDGATYSIATLTDPDYVKAHGRRWVNSDSVVALTDRPKTDRKAVRAFNPKYLADIARAADILHPRDYPQSQVRHLEPMQPVRFDIVQPGAEHIRMVAILMPVRVQPPAQEVA